MTDFQKYLFLIYTCDNKEKAGISLGEIGGLCSPSWWTVGGDQRKDGNVISPVIFLLGL